MTEEFLSWLAAVIAERGTLFKGIKILSSEEYKALVESEQADPDMLYLVWDEGEVLSGVKIIVNGEAVDEFNADTKVDRVDEPNQLYGTDENGNPTTYPTDSVGTQVKVDGQKVKEFNADEKFDKTGGVISGNVAIQGDLSVTGTTTTKNTETLNVKDNVIVANADGAEVIEDSGFAIKTSTTTAYGIMYDPVGDGVKIGLGSFDENGKFIYDEGEAQFLATRADNITEGNLPQWDNEKKQFVDSGEKIGDFLKKADSANSQQIAEKIRTDRFLSPYYIERIGVEALANCKDTTLWTDDSTVDGQVVKGTKTKALELLGAIKADTSARENATVDARVYGIDSNGNQIVYSCTYRQFSNTIAYRDKNACVAVGTPLSNGDATTKLYVDNLPDNLKLTDEEKAKWADFVGAVKKLGTKKLLYGNNSNGVPFEILWSEEATSYSIARRGEGGVLPVGTPTDPTHATPKGYVDGKIAEVAEEVKTVESIAKGANQAISFADYQTMIAALNSLPKDKYNIGQSIYIGTLNVPDIWVSGILDNSVAYTYTTDEDIAEKLKTNNAVQAGHYILSPLETQKVDLTDYVKNTEFESVKTLAQQLQVTKQDQYDENLNTAEKVIHDAINEVYQSVQDLQDIADTHITRTIMTIAELVQKLNESLIETGALVSFINFPNYGDTMTFAVNNMGRIETTFVKYEKAGNLNRFVCYEFLVDGTKAELSGECYFLPEVDQSNLLPYDYLKKDPNLKVILYGGIGSGSGS